MNKEKIYYFYTLSTSDDEENIRYVGVTCTSVRARFRGHKYCAMHKERRGLPVHKWMYSKYEKGLDIIPKEIDSCSEDEWEDRERYWIKYYKDLGYNLLNIDKGGRGVVTAEMRSKSSIERSVESKRIPIIALSLEGQFVKRYASVTAAAEELGCSLSNINNVLKGATNTAEGFIWVYEAEYDPNIKYGVKTEYARKEVYRFDKDKNLIKKYDSISDILQEFNIHSYTGIYDAVKRKRLYKGSYWAYTSDFNATYIKKEYKYKVTEGKSELFFKTRKELEQYLNISGPYITTSLKQHNPWDYKGKIIEAI